MNPPEVIRRDRPCRLPTAWATADRLDIGNLLSYSGEIEKNLGPRHHDALRRHNRRVVVEVLGTLGAATRAELAAASGLTSPTVGSLLSELAEVGRVMTAAPEPGVRGRPAQRFALDPSFGQITALAVYSDRIAAETANAQGTVTASMQRPLAVTEVRSVLNEIVDLAKDLHDVEARHHRLIVAVPGRHDPATGLVDDIAAWGWFGVALAPALTERVPHTVTVVDLAVAEAVGLAHRGAIAGAPGPVGVVIARERLSAIVVDREPATGRAVVNRGRGRAGLVPAEIDLGGAIGPEPGAGVADPQVLADRAAAVTEIIRSTVEAARWIELLHNPRRILIAGSLTEASPDLRTVSSRWIERSGLGVHSATEVELVEGSTADVLVGLRLLLGPAAPDELIGVGSAG